MGRKWPDGWPDDSEFFSAPEHTEPELGLAEFHERLFNDAQPPKFVESPPTWQGTPSGRKQTTMDDFIKEHFPNGMYIPGYMLRKRD